jgi:hypothetical protein
MHGAQADAKYMRAFGNRVLRRVFGHKGEEVRGG